MVSLIVTSAAAWLWFLLEAAQPSGSLITSCQDTILYVQDAKMFPKCYVGRNGNLSEISKKYAYKCADHSRHNGIKGAKAKINVHTNQHSKCWYFHNPDCSRVDHQDGICL